MSHRRGQPIQLKPEYHVHLTASSLQARHNWGRSGWPTCPLLFLAPHLFPESQALAHWDWCPHKGRDRVLSTGLILCGLLLSGQCPKVILQNEMSGTFFEILLSVIEVPHLQPPDNLLSTCCPLLHSLHRLSSLTVHCWSREWVLACSEAGLALAPPSHSATTRTGSCICSHRLSDPGDTSRAHTSGLVCSMNRRDYFSKSQELMHVLASPSRLSLFQVLQLLCSSQCPLRLIRDGA